MERFFTATVSAWLKAGGQLPERLGQSSWTYSSMKVNRHRKLIMKKLRAEKGKTVALSRLT